MRKIFKKIFPIASLVILSVSSLVIANYAIKINQENRSQAATIAGNTRQAGSVGQVEDCVGKLNAGTVDSIEITKKIACDAANPCNLVIRAQKGSIYGTPGTDAGFLRTELFKPALF